MSATQSNTQLTTVRIRTVICSLRNSKSSSQFARLASAALIFSSSIATASSMGYASITFAPSQRYTSSVSSGEIVARAYRVSFNSKEVDIGAVVPAYGTIVMSTYPHTTAQRTALDPALNMYTHLLPIPQKPHRFQRLPDIRNLVPQPLTPPLRVDFHELVLGDHLLERAQRRLDFGARRDVVGYIVDKGCDGDAARVGGCCWSVVRERVS